MKLGAEPKKTAFLGLLLLIAAYGVYSNFASSPDSAPSPAPRPAPEASAPTIAPAAAAPVGTATQQQTRRAITKSTSSEFKPRLGVARPEDRPDPSTIDPKLKLDLLAKVQAVTITSVGRNLFQFGVAPPPPKPIELPKEVAKIPINQPPVNAGPPPPPPGPPPPPPPAPITFKYYGYRVSKTDGTRVAFLLDGDEILLAAENSTIKLHYRIVKVGPGGVTIEDTQSKNTQTLPIQEAPAS